MSEPSSPSPEPARPERSRNPWWIPPFLGSVPKGVEHTQLNLLGFVALAMFFENYDYALLTNVLKYLAEDFGLDKTDLGWFTGAIRLGTLPAFFIVPFADRIGRRRLFLVSIIGLSIGTFITAFSQTAEQFILCQVLSRSFMITASAIAYVIVTEELPAAHRGWGIGILGAVASFGFGVSALLFAFIDSIPYGWRGMYALGLAPLLLLPVLRRQIPETARFKERARQLGRLSASQVMTGALKPVLELLRANRRHAAGVIALGFLSTAGHATAFQLTAEFVLTVRGWSNGEYAAMLFFCGAFGIVGSPIAGRLGDRFGRRAIGAAVLGVFPLTAAAFYLGPGWAVPVAWVAMVFTSMAAGVVVRGLTNEVFPTSQRATASGLLLSVETLGAASSLFLYSYLMSVLDEQQGLAVASISLLALVSTGFLVLFPETRQRELEAISGE
jgi:putative MFS transporter